jgi:hypothetical protein
VLPILIRVSRGQSEYRHLDAAKRMPKVGSHRATKRPIPLRMKELTGEWKAKIPVNTAISSFSMGVSWNLSESVFTCTAVATT